ncbi:helix-turn-helix domain-containing protein [Eubacteriales bacterium OttesenSCG-928-N13]|nr:helix-turn-helix domain-containing protein [Eubacteriales bacterium OttesenSCG-928-N13]
MDYNELGRRIRALRKNKHWTQEKLSESAGISLSFLGHSRPSPPRRA